MKIFDLHNDFLTALHNNGKQDKYLLKEKERDTIMALWTTNLTNGQIEKQMQRAMSLKEKHNNLYFAIEDFGFVNAENYQKVIDTKPVYIGLTWNDENMLAGGAYSNGELTKLGKHIIDKLNSDKIVIDTAHLNEKSFIGVANTSNKIICSHTAFSGVFDHKRNLKDYQIKIIVERGGLIGLCLCDDFLSPYKKVTIEDYANHIEYFLDKYGDNNLAIGTDFYGTKKLPKGIKRYSDLKKVEILLTKNGYSDKTIAKIFYKNAENFFNEV